MKKKKGWVRLPQEIKATWIGDNHYAITDGEFTMSITTSAPLCSGLPLPGKIVIHERYYKKGDDVNLILKTKIKEPFIEEGWIYYEKYQPVLLNGRPIIRKLTYDPTGKVRDYRINPNRLTGLIKTK